MQCQISVSITLGSTAWYAAVQVANKSFAYNYTFTTPGDTTHVIGGKCWNRLNIPPLNIAGSSIEVREIPEQMTNFSLALSKQIVSINENFYIYLVFLKGNHMNCSVSSSSSGISQHLTYNQLIAYQQSYSNGRKAYRLFLSTNVFSLAHRIDVVCRNVWEELSDNVTFQAQIPVSGISMTVGSLVCFGDSFDVSSSLLAGAPIHKALYIDSIQIIPLDYYSINVTSNTFPLLPMAYGAAGRKNIHVRAWNDVSSLTSSTSVVRIAKTITILSDVTENFTLTSLQAKTVRPRHVLPASKVIVFAALVTPNADGYDYRWMIDNVQIALGTAPTWSRTFSTPGQYKFKLIVDGCNSKTYEQNMTVVSPIEDFSLSYIPSPEVVVNKSATISITNARQSECLQLDFGDLSTPMMHCKNYTTSSDLDCFTVGSVCQITHVYTKRGNFTVKVTASNELYERSKEIVLVAKTCYNPTLSVQGKFFFAFNLLINVQKGSFRRCNCCSLNSMIHQVPFTWIKKLEEVSMIEYRS